jgi:hypothetical protein
MVDGFFLISQLPPLRHFLFPARGSLVELETQILRAGKLQYLSAEQSTLLKRRNRAGRESGWAHPRPLDSRAHSKDEHLDEK